MVELIERSEGRLRPAASPRPSRPRGISPSSGPSAPTGPPRAVVRARRPLTPQALVERADVVLRSVEAETVLRIHRRRRELQAALYVDEMHDLASPRSEGDEHDEKTLHALAAAAALRVKLPRGEDRLRDAHVAVEHLPACFARAGRGELPIDWFEWLIRSVLRLAPAQRLQVDERVAAWQLEAIDVERFYSDLRILVEWFGRAAVQESPEEQRGVHLQPSSDSDGTACLMIRGPLPELAAFGHRLDAAARTVQDAQRRALRDGTPIPFDLDGDVARQGEHMSLEALRYEVALRSALTTGAVEVPEPSFRISVVVPVLTLLGLSHAPATLDGTIPIPARMARRLVAQAPAFERVLTDPISGAYLASASRTYRPTAAMAEHLRLIDPICAVPTCSRNVMTIGEADRIEEFDLEHPARGGPTSLDNLHRLCRRHHRLETTGGLDPQRDPRTGATRWRIGDAAVSEVAGNTDLVTRELGARLERAWEQHQADVEVDALTRLGVLDESPAEIADREEAHRWGMHLMEH